MIFDCCNIILSQSSFDLWGLKTSLRPKKSKFQLKLRNFITENADLIEYKPDKILRQKYLSLNSDILRKKFVKFLTGRMFNRSLKRRGFEHDDMVKNCRICHRPLDSPDSELEHLLDQHLNQVVESYQKNSNPRPILSQDGELNVSTVDNKVLCKLFDIVKDHWADTMPRKRRKIIHEV